VSIPPGGGAVEFGRSITEGLARAEAAAIISRLITLDDAELREEYGQRVKRCCVCRYPFTDRTKPGNATVCGDSCKTLKKTAQRSVQRSRHAKVERKSIPYVWWFEYPFWISENVMLSRVWSYERPSARVTEIQASRQTAEKTGGKRVRPERVDY
jgi:hypothetical protein